MKTRVLIIEDEPAIRRLMTMALEPTGYEVAVAEAGPVGLSRFGTGAGWDAVLLDQRMPGMEGLEVLRRIKTLTTTVPVIMITAYPSIDLAVDAMKIGAVDFLRKPVVPEVLRSAVAAALQRRPAPRAAVTEVRGKQRPDIEMVTMNGFRIVNEGSEPAEGRYRFSVFAGAADTAVPVTVQIGKDAMATVERLVGRKFDPASPHWEVLAEDYLAAYLWNDQHIPTQPIVLKDITADDLNNVNFWPMGK